jgi:GDSL-like Lipase/Acylhydrolase family
MRLALLVVAAACGPSLPAPNDLAPGGTTRYPHDAVSSPITPSVAASLRAIAARGAHREEVFMKVGASGTVSTNLLHCFAGLPEYTLDLDGRTDLQPTIDFFRGGRIDATTPFDRVTLAASVGKSAVWAITGSPSPLAGEMAAADPRYAFINYGTNDMELGSTYDRALFAFWDNFSTLLDQVEDAGIIPLVTGLNPRADSAAAALWVPTFDALTRAVAEARQVPYFSLELATSPLPAMGLGPDGLHGNVYTVNGAAQPCVFTPDGLAFNYNVRNLASLRMLDSARLLGAPDADVLPPIAGDGSDANPFVVDRLPFSHAFDTRMGESARDRYPACDQGQDESGPERSYRLELAQPIPLRLFVFARGTVDVDVHLLDEAGACLARNDRMLAQTLPAGRYTVVVDSFVSPGTAHSGAYLLLMMPCAAADTSC